MSTDQFIAVVDSLVRTIYCWLTFLSWYVVYMYVVYVEKGS